MRNILLVHRDSRLNTVVPGFRVLGFRALPGFRALNPATEVGRYIKRYLDLEHLFSDPFVQNWVEFLGKY